ncbi:MAG: isopenicillin N synthase family oxygenase [Alphaproteobacteria bacterium]|nr:isopenicillin N synthase family oxygenase [Alphaproteobacteria bacterium]MBV9585609.1 isopenicillin N synthase family oxygenase [Alphaproteobacteria bacterium]MBV9964979.1 isopenicillin N synthase family oxygenase [Alphaproteobacteria bacterium]
MKARPATDLDPAPMIAGAIPLIDVAGHLGGDPESSRKAATQLRGAFESVGFYYLAGHGVPQSLIDQTYEAAARFHTQPMATKLALKVNEHNTGYLPISGAASPQAAAQGRKPSQNEAYFLRRERAPNDPSVIANRRFHGLNQWPDDLPGFRATTLEYMRTLEALCRRLVPLYALALDLPANFFDACFAVPHMILRMSRYPALDGEDATVASLVPHTDSGFMTLLPPNRVPGLSILLPNGQWIDAPGIDGAYIVNGGDILHRWTNERFLSTPHRVRNLSGQVRYAIPFFCDPDHDTIIECLPSCRSADDPPKYPPIRFGDYALWFARKSYEHMANEPALPDALVEPGPRAVARW